MSGSTNKTDAERLLRGLDDGKLTTSEGAMLAQDLDPVLVYVILRYLRETYPAIEPCCETRFSKRVVSLTSSWPGIVTKIQGRRTGPCLPMVLERVLLRRLSRAAAPRCST